MPTITLDVEEAAATPWSAASLFCAGETPTLLFEHQTARAGDGGAYSVLCTEPCCWLVEEEGRFIEQPAGRIIDDPLSWMRDHHRPTQYEGGPFTGGLAGVLGFEFGWRLDSLDLSSRHSSTPELWVGEFEAGAVYDHRRALWSVAGRSRRRVEQLAEKLRRAPESPKVGHGSGDSAPKGVGPSVYTRRVGDAIDAICGGEFFEVNYTERFRADWSGDPRAIYDGLRRLAPGDYGGLIDVPELFVASISPEQFLCVHPSAKVVTRPIKGTRPRGATPSEDRRLARELLTSEKDRAENVMIVDLMRNDLTRVCEPGTVRATSVCELHSFESVHHLISTVRGRLSDKCTALDAFLAGFPAGSITGAPKLRSMEWIAENEESSRGPYTGSMFYWSDHGRLDSNVLIRTAVLVDGKLEYGSGGAVVADSDPTGEYEEALWKAKPFFELMESKDDE